MLDNGGPLLDDDAAPKLRWIKLNIAEFLEGIDELTYEQRGFYITALLKMYARHDGIPVDDRDGAQAMGCNPRTFRLHKASLLEAGKFYVSDGMLRNKRFDYELAEFTRQAKKRREAALKRERERREAITAYTTQQRSAPIRGEFEPNSSRIRPEFDPNSVPKNAENPTKSACAAQQAWREPELEPEPELERKNPPTPQEGVRMVGGRLALFNGTRQFWLDEFAGDAKGLDLALIEASGSIQPNSRSHPLEAQVGRLLARIVRDKRDRDTRYQEAAKRNAEKASKPAKPTFRRY
jgi:uncharacterized protein YdaU (DUF1376 family)